ncbi:hypothetical protein CRE_03282 [Caenorhabditis remanei]|uniref:Uncharacterized protein n=1 Tax=Caenorhabditis remanei TaxID=31234 RepID=E3MME7_CAERE|nr:hypothetical protein CRE_03282 [Caenorhabditis remanei]
MKIALALLFSALLGLSVYATEEEFEPFMDKKFWRSSRLLDSETADTGSHKVTVAEMNDIHDGIIDSMLSRDNQYGNGGITDNDESESAENKETETAQINNFDDIFEAKLLNLRRKLIRYADQLAKTRKLRINLFETLGLQEKDSFAPFE